ncbi:MAG: hypothetical protein ACLRSW_05415 [Christensenellaceae bacterium]
MADYLKRGVPFRIAHGVVGKSCAIVSKGQDAGNAVLDEYRAHEAFGEDILSLVRARASADETASAAARPRRKRALKASERG